ncbi:MAG TPA: hypothetical protein VK658_09670 [Chryseolinea sp.]|nr:hypothetical protein [Chryseolinea sp.]
MGFVPACYIGSRMESRDIYVIPYGSTRWGWKYKDSIAQKIYNDLDECLHYCRIQAKKDDSKLYLEVKPGKFIMQKV